MKNSVIHITAKFFEKIYHLHWKQVYAVCFSYTQNKALSEDFVQDIFKSLWERKDALQIESSVENYLLSAARIKVFNHIRTTSIHRRHNDTIAAQGVLAESTTEDMVLYKSLRQNVAGIAERLSPQVKAVYTLNRTEGLKTADVADRLNISEKTVKNHLTKALQTIREKLEDYER